MKNQRKEMWKRKIEKKILTKRKETAIRKAGSKRSNKRVNERRKEERKNECW